MTSFLGTPTHLENVSQTGLYLTRPGSHNEKVATRARAFTGKDSNAASLLGRNQSCDRREFHWIRL